MRRTVCIWWLLGALAACSSTETATGEDQQAVTAPTCTTLVANGDATLSRTNMKANAGSKKTLLVGDGDESVLQFDLSSIPATAPIVSSTMQLYISDNGGQPVEIHRAKAAWTEATVTFASFANQFANRVVGVIDTGRDNVVKSVDLTHLTRRWLKGKIANDGVVLHGTGQHETTFVSREGGTADQRPKLVVCYAAKDACASDPCRNGGECEDTANGFACECAAGFTGPTCATKVDACASDPCQNGGSCTDAGSSYTCTCATGFTGADCETNIDDCSPDPCENGGVCEDGIASYTCTCPAGYTGAQCQTMIDECASAPCQNGGTCTDTPDAYTCACAVGFTGANCETNIDDCAGDPCANGGTCIDGIASFTCACPADWGGPTCDVNLDTCAQNPCLNGATCVNGAGTYTCECQPGYTGGNCEVDINDCASNPCQNGGVCVDGINSFTCTCQNGFIGSLCQTAVQTMQLKGTVRDFPNGYSPGDTTLATEGYALGPDGYPEEEAPLWTDVPGTNTSAPFSLTLSNAGQADPTRFAFDTAAFSPLGTNDAFTLELHTSITYAAGTQLAFLAGDRVLVFFNDEMVLNAGSGGGTADLDSFAAQDQLAIGEVYPLDIYITHAAGASASLHLESIAPTCSPRAQPNLAFVPLDQVDLIGSAAIGTIGFVDPEDTIYGPPNPLGFFSVIPTPVPGIQLVPQATTTTAGAAWNPQPIANGVAFHTSFEFQFAQPGEGFAFVLAPTPTVGGSSFNLGYGGIPSSVAVEFDTHQDPQLLDPASPEVGVHTLGSSPNSPVEGAAVLGSATQALSLDGTPIRPLFGLGTVDWWKATIDYEPQPGLGYGWMRIYLDDGGFDFASGYNPNTPVLAVQIPDATMAALGPVYYMGLTSSTFVGTPANVNGETDIVWWKASTVDCNVATCAQISAAKTSATAAPGVLQLPGDGSILVQARDAADMPFGTGGAVACFAAAIANGSESDAASVFDNGDGTYSVSYAPGAAGAWTLDVQAGGGDIAGSPYPVSVLAP